MENKEESVEDPDLTKRLTEAVHTGNLAEIQNILKQVKDLEGEVVIEHIGSSK